MSRTMALDVGSARVGVAVSDPLGITAQPVATIHRTGIRQDLKAIGDLARQHEADSIVVGLPLKLDGEPGPAAVAILQFVDRLRAAVSIPVVTWDERLSTVQAERALLEGDMSRSRRRETIDRVAAVLILQAYLDSRPKEQA